jgi:hypothetical protein
MENKDTLTIIEELTKQKWFYYNMYTEYDSKIKKLKEELESKCIHDWEIDTSYSDHRTVYTCKKCGK